MSDSDLRMYIKHEMLQTGLKLAELQAIVDKMDRNALLEFCSYTTKIKENAEFHGRRFAGL